MGHGGADVAIKTKRENKPTGESIFKGKVLFITKSVLSGTVMRRFLHGHQRSGYSAAREAGGPADKLQQSQT
jgi:hypothetical protein